MRKNCMGLTRYNPVILVNPPITIDYSPQLLQSLNKLDQLIYEIQTFDANNNQNNSNIIAQLQQLGQLGNAFLTLFQQNQATQEQIKGIITQISNQVATIPTAIQNFQSAAIGALTTLGSLIQAETDATNLKLAQIETTLQDLSTVKEGTWYEDRIIVDTTTAGKTVTVPAGAVEIVAYCLGQQRDYVVNGKTYRAGEEYTHGGQSVGNMIAVYDAKTIQIPIGQGEFQIEFKALRNIGSLGVSDNNIAPIVDPYFASLVGSTVITTQPTGTGYGYGSSTDTSGQTTGSGAG